MIFEQLIAECEALLRAGKTQEVAARLNPIKPAQIPREWRKPVAGVCRRAGLITQGLKILSPFVRHDAQAMVDEPTAAELAEYGALLWRVGAVSEALTVLKDVDKTQAPEAYLYQAFCYFSRWENEEVLPILEKYLRAPIPRYSAMVGGVNVCNALIGTRRYLEARTLLDSHLEMTKSGEFWRLHSNCLELSAQVYIRQGEFAKARRDLNEAEQILNDNRITDQLYIKKWQAVLEAFESNSADGLHKFRAEAVQRNEWESVREADLFILRFAFHQETFEHLIFGTPFMPYRERACLELGNTVTRPLYNFGQTGGAELEIVSGKLRQSNVDLKPGSLVHRVLDALTRDLYRPHSMGAFFSALCPGEYFDPYSSPNRMHQLIRRTRQWLSENRFPVVIENLASGYRVKVEGPFSFLLPLEHKQVSRHDLQWERIVSKFRDENFFSAQEGRNHLGVPPTTFKRLMRWAVDNKLVEKRGGGSNVLYKLRVSA